MAEIPLSQGKVAIVDDWLFDVLNQFKWYARHSDKNWYAVRMVRLDDRRMMIRMHTCVVGELGYQIDHIDGDGLNNRLSNLRLASTRENNRNRRKRASASSRYKGISWYKPYRKWVARIRAGEIQPNGHARRLHLGYYTSEIEAALAYDAAARQYFGAFAKLNFPNGHDHEAPEQIAINF